MDTNDVNRAGGLISEHRQIVSAIAALDADARITSIFLQGPNTSPPNAPILVQASYIEYPPQMVAGIRSALDARLRVVRDELTNLGVRGIDGIPPGPREIFPPLSRRQFFLMGALAPHHLISEEEALAAMQHGAIPKVMEEFIAQYVPQDQKFAARMLIAGASEFDRRHPFVGQIAQALGLDKEQTDAFWREGAKL